MGQFTLPGNPPIAVKLKRSGRARRISLRVSALDGLVTLTLPPRVREREALDFARSKETWLRRALEDRPAPAQPAFGGWLPVEGRELPIVAVPGLRRLRITAEAIEAPQDADRLPARLAAALKLLARDRLADACDRHAAALGRGYGRMTLRDTRSRWGSCSSRGDLMFSWRLVMAPPPVLDYVAAHEVAHLVEMNHAPQFWAVVARLCPGYESPRGWLRTNGSLLHRHQFTAPQEEASGETSC